MFASRAFIFLISASAVLCGFISTGCAPSNRPVFEERDEPDYQKGKRLLRQGEDEQALLSFLRVIDSRTDSPESHLEAGLLYLEEMNEPVLSIYHFIKFLELRPEARQAPEVENLIDTAKKEFARTLPGRPFEGGLGQTDLLEVLEREREDAERSKARIIRLERENQDLRRRIDALTNRGAFPSTDSSREAENNEGNSPAVYVVQPGDTLSSIARSVFGSSARWEEIFQANRDLLRSPNDLRVGQELQIPPE
ncbi:MAG: LysM peptidoglycan-binding domain-containing protein [Verrucomicrobiota bacterium]